jgi:hypothetical protein
MWILEIPCFNREQWNEHENVQWKYPHWGGPVQLKITYILTHNLLILYKIEVPAVRVRFSFNE